MTGNLTDCTDANGNILGGTLSGGSCSGQLYSYDVANRMHPLTGSYYSYAPGNKRVWRGAMDNSGNITLDEVTFWSVTGQRLATYNLSQGATLTTTVLTESLAVSRTYFGGRLIANGTGNVATDRLGSIGKYYPWGQVKPSGNVVGTEGFTGYFRDQETQLDYAVNRYHQPGVGRFMSPDPYQNSAGPNDPGSWNRYAYVRGDPVNRIDVTGLDDDGEVAECDDECDSEEEDDGGAGGGGGGDQGACIGGCYTGTGPIYQSGVTFTATGTAEPIYSLTSNTGVLTVADLIGDLIGEGVCLALEPCGAVEVIGGVAVFVVTVGVSADLTTPTTWNPHRADIGGPRTTWMKRGGQGKGERNRAGNQDGTNNPGKHARPKQGQPGRWEVKDPHTGKWVTKPPGWKPDR